jgi:hypothetical protein
MIIMPVKTIARFQIAFKSCLYFTDALEHDKSRKYFPEKYSRFNPNVNRQLTLVFG